MPGEMGIAHDAESFTGRGQFFPPGSILTGIEQAEILEDPRGFASWRLVCADASAMYLPEDFEETNPERISALIDSHPLGMLVTAPDGIPFVSHLPFLHERGAGAKGKLIGHMARANPQWRHFSSGAEALAVFQGPHAYVSPSWYASPGVPTWNYAVVHVRGRPAIVEGEAELEGLLERLTRIHESARPNPWKPNLAGERRAKLLGAIVGFEIEITSALAKFKLSQNRPPEDRRRVASELRRSGSQIDAAVGELMSEATDRAV